MAGLYEHGLELLVSIKEMKILDLLSYYQLLRKNFSMELLATVLKSFPNPIQTNMIPGMGDQTM